MKKIVLFILMATMLFAMPKFLMPDEAFKPKALLNSQSQIEVDIEIAKDIYLYEERVTLEITNSNGISIENIQSPKSVEHHGEMVYLESPSFRVDLKRDDDVTGIKNITFLLSYQGCSEQGLCYEPLSKEYKFEIDSEKLSTPVEIKQEKKELSKSDAIADTISSGNIFLILATFFGFGLLLALTPCVFPMIPIISALIISQGKNITTKKAFALSIVYVLAMAVAYTIAGVLAGLFGANLQAALQAPLVIYSFSAIFVVLALSMFGYYELKLPDSLVTKISSANHSSGYAGVAIMGFLSALIVGPCVAAPLAGALVYIGQTGDAILGGMALFAMSIGMGVPLIAVG
ncbi:MAG: protein-disulfide reductase DsbD family protein, partial [Campylobacterota bacterium]|nr:protein-disulfide reductase DsbD family protein [Campylobacterota bacterium]